MAIYRSGRLEENRQKKRLGLAMVGSLVIVLFLILFGVKILIGFSLLADRLRGNPTTQMTQPLLLPPILDPLPIATKSATLVLTGSGPEGSQIIIYINEEEKDRISVEKDGTFKTILTSLADGNNTISARATNGQNNISNPSNILTIDIKKTPPVFELTAPNDHTTINGDTNRVAVEGKTEDNTSVSINGRIVVVRSDNSFSYEYPLNEGENKLTIEVTDDAGNTSIAQRTVTYQR